MLRDCLLELLPLGDEVGTLALSHEFVEFPCAFVGGLTIGLPLLGTTKLVAQAGDLLHASLAFAL